MKWRKMGLIYRPDGRSSWAKHSALTPTPIVLDADTVRVYVGFRDDAGVSRIGFVDIDASDPTRVLGVSKEPALDIGIPGAFDDNGVILGEIVGDGRQLKMFYVGFQLVQKAKFLAFTGLAVSDDGGVSFTRVKRTPILDRSDEGVYIRTIHSVVVEDGVWRVWYAAGSSWTLIGGRPYPSYHIRYTESRDGITFADEGTVCIRPEGDEYRIGRPRVSRRGNGYWMFYTKGTLRKEYMPGYAASENGIKWTRMDGDVGISCSAGGWDSEMLCYPTVFRWSDRTYMLYNGNNYGETGLGYAVLES